MKKELEYILAVAEEGSTAKAAERLFVGQPAVSKVIASVERSLGVKLFFRNHKGMIPTDAGWLYIEYANRIKDIEERMYEQLQGTSEEIRNVIRIAMTLNASTLYTDEINKHIEEEFPGYYLQIDNVLTKDILEGLRSGRYRYAICPQRILEGQKDLYSEELFSSSWLFITPKSLDLSSECRMIDGQLYIPTDIIRRQEMVLQEEGTNIRYEMDEVLGLKDIGRHMKREVANSLLAIEEVYDGAGCAILSTIFRVYLNHEKVNIYAVDTEKRAVTSLVYLRGKKISEEEKAMVRRACEYLISNNQTIR